MRHYHHFHNPRAGLSLIEILASVTILTIGILGTIIAVMLGGIQVRRAKVADYSATCSRAALHQIQMADWQKPEAVDPVNTLRFAPGNPNDLRRVVDPYIVDPLAFWKYDGTLVSPDPYVFPSKRTSGNGLRRYPMTYYPNSVNWLNYDDTMSMFRASDDIRFEPPTDNPQGRPTTIGGNPVQSEGMFSWMYMVSPMVPSSHVNRLSFGTNDVRGCADPKYISSYEVSSIVFYGRVPPEGVNDPGERTVNATFSGSTGHLILSAQDIDDLDLSTIRWILLTGFSPDYAPWVNIDNPGRGVVVAKWYRVVGEGEITENQTGGYQRQVFVLGPAWNGTYDTNITAILCDDVVDVRTTIMPR